MKKETIITISIFALALILAIAFSFVYLRKSALAPEKTGKNEPISTTTTTITARNNDSKPAQSGIIGNRSRSELPSFPSDWDKVSYGPDVIGFPLDARKRYEDRFKVVVSRINQTPDMVDLWIDLGLIKKTFEDYVGARDAWEFASLIRPKNATSFINLGDLYWHFLPDFGASELNYKKALVNSPGTLGIYKDLSDLYRFSYKEKAGLADDIILEGLALHPKSIDLLMWLASYFRDIGDKNNAIKYYSEVLKIDPTNAAAKSEL